MSTPSLLNIPYLYKAGTLYSQIPESGAGDFTVSRTTTVANRSTRINKDGFIETVLDNVPRLDYPLGGAVNGCPALLVEPAATNLVQRSEEFSNVYWSKDAGVTVDSNVDVAPDGATTADRLNLTTNGAVYRSGFSLSGSHTFSIYLKGEGQNIGKQELLEFTNGNSTVTLTGNWQRFTTTGTNTVNVAIKRATSQQAASVLAWGAQLETGSVPTSYIFTTTASVTRSAEIISDTTAGALIGQSEGTIYAEVDVRNFVNFSRVVALSDGTANNSIGLQLFLNGAVKSLRVGLSFLGSGQVDIIAAMPNAVNKIAVGYKQNDFVVYLNGSSVGTDTSCSVPAMNKIDLGNINGVNIIADRIRAVALYPNRIPNTAAPGVLSLATLTAL